MIGWCDMENILITLYGENSEEILYKVDRIFAVEGEEKMYCSVVPASGGDILFLECVLTEDGENTELSVADITNMAEYNRVAVAYEKAATRAAMEQVYDELHEFEDYITVTDADGKKVDFIVHTIFEDKESGRSYIAMQKVDDAGDVFEEISLYRFVEGEENAIDMIPSDMEYERARNIFMSLIAE